MMKIEAKIFWILTLFGVVVTVIYGFTGHTPEGDFEPTGFVALLMMTLLTLLTAFYITFGAGRHRDPRPEDRKDGEIVEGAGDLGFFPPYSWWPLWGSLTFGVCMVGIAVGWWLFVIGAMIGTLTLIGFVLEYYRGDHAH